MDVALVGLIEFASLHAGVSIHEGMNLPEAVEISCVEALCRHWTLFGRVAVVFAFFITITVAITIAVVVTVAVAMVVAMAVTGAAFSLGRGFSRKFDVCLCTQVN